MNELFEVIFKFFNSFKPWVVIVPWEQGVRVRLGKYAALLSSGVHLKIPFADEVFVQSTRLRTVNITTQTVMTLDGKTLTLSAAFQYQINDMLKLFTSMQNPENTIGNIILGYIAKTLLEKVSNEINPLLLGKEITELVTADKYGLGSFDVFITDFAVVRTFRLMQESWRSEIGNLDMEVKR